MKKNFKITTPQLFVFLILAFLFLCAVNVFNQAHIFLIAAFLLFAFTPGRKLSMNSTLLLLVVFSFSMVVFNKDVQSGISTIIMAFFYPMSYLIGRTLFLSDVKTLEDIPPLESKTMSAVCVVAIGTFVHYVLNMLVNIGRSDRNVIEFWSRKELSATGQATFACLIIGVAAAILFSDVSKKKKLLAALALIVVISYNFILAGRTLFVLLAVAVIVSYFYKNLAVGKGIIKSIVIFIIVFALLVICYNYNIFNIKTIYENSNFYDRFYGGEYTQDIDADHRMEYKLYYIEHFFDNVWGGGYIRSQLGHSAHDLYLDTYDESGIFALLAIVIYILSSWRRMFRCLKSKSISLTTKQYVLSIYLVVNIIFFLEPIIRGMPWLLYFYCFIDGLLSSVLNQTKAVER